MYTLLRFWPSFAGGVASIAAVLLFQFFPAREAFVLIAVIWHALLYGLYRVSERKHGPALPILSLIIATAVSTTLGSLLVEWDPLFIALPIFAGLAIGFLFYQHASEERWVLMFQRKPVRRLNMMLSVFHAYAMVTACFAASLFFEDLPFLLLAILGAGATAFFSFSIWRLYYELPFSAFRMWVLLIFAAVLELMWAIHLLPFGYFVSGFLTVWIWYILQLLLRFHLSPQGITWQKQWRFLTVNLGLFVVFLWVIRWI